MYEIVYLSKIQSFNKFNEAIKYFIGQNICEYETLKKLNIF
jgi:hypothetical protein